MKKILYTFLLLILTVNSQAAITFVDGKWETTFAGSEITQIDAGWQNSTGLPDDLELWSDNYFQPVALSSGGSTTKWNQSSGQADEWYYNENLSAYEPDALGPYMLTVDDVVQQKFNSQNGVIGSLIAGERGWGDDDSIGFNTIYIQSATDPDTFTGNSVAWISHSSLINYVAGDVYSEISVAANNPLGTGNGFTGSQGDGSSLGTGQLKVVFPSKEKEVWIRWYMKSSLGFAWQSILADKSIYLRTDGDIFPVEARGYHEYSILIQSGASEYQVSTSPFGFSDVNDNGDLGDGEYHCFEIQMKLDTDTTDGIGRIWIDGVIRAENTSVDYSNGDTDTQGGITFFSFENNQAWVQNSKTVKVSYDDMVIYNETPPGDCDGTPCIGPIPTGTAGTTGISATGSTGISATGSTSVGG